jgi:hypothetical protein
VIPVNAASQTSAVAHFETVVSNIEQCVAAEAAAGSRFGGGHTER